MLRDILTFNQQSTADHKGGKLVGITLGEYFRRNHFAPRLPLNVSRSLRNARNAQIGRETMNGPYHHDSRRTPKPFRAGSCVFLAASDSGLPAR